jgi:WD40 repeat protein
MRTLIVFATLFLLFGFSVQAQNEPVIYFFDEPLTHNMHMTSDGEYYYTVNGGIAEDGQINQYTFDGEYVDSYPIYLDMRGIMYNPKDKSLYVNTYEKEIYKITDLYYGDTEYMYTLDALNEQATPAISTDGKYLYAFDYGVVTIFKLKNGKVVKELYDFGSGDDPITGSSAIAVDGKYIYTWDAGLQEIYVYTLSGEVVKTVTITDGDYGFSLSAANGKIFVSVDGDYDTGVWYGYNIW